jgi:xanthosine utilization system XapX-like protein
MNVNAMYRTPLSRSSGSLTSSILLALKAGAAAALVAALLSSRVPEPVIIVGVIVVASLIGWHRVQLMPARVRSQHRFTVVSRCGDGFVTIDSSGVRRVARRLVLGSPSN